MPKARDPNRDTALEMYKDNKGIIDLVEIASQLNILRDLLEGGNQQINGMIN